VTASDTGAEHRQALVLGQPNLNAAVRVAVTSLPAGASTRAGIELRETDPANFYRASVVFGSSSSHSIQLELTSVVNGASTPLSTKTIFTTGLANTYYWIRFLANGSSLKARLWKDGTPEPTTWPISVTNSALTTGGTAALTVVHSTGSTNTPTVRLDDLTVVGTTGTTLFDEAMYSAVIAPTRQAPQNTAPPTVSGTAMQGSTLTADPGTWSGSPAPSFSYQWQRCDNLGANCADISQATAQTYLVDPADVGNTLRVNVTGTNIAGSAVASSSVTAVVTAGTAPQNTAPPVVTGIAQETRTLTTTSGTWTGVPTPSYSYQWERCVGAVVCSPIAGATASTYVVVSADVGSTLRSVLTATNVVGSANQASAITATVTPAGPSTSLLDDFNRADNTGPPGPSWTHLIVSSTAASNDFHITSNRITGISGSNADYWNVQQFGPNAEVWVTVAVKPSADQDTVALGLRFQNPNLSTANGYQGYFYNRTGTDTYQIGKRTNGSFSALASVTGPELSAGDQLLFRAVGSTLELWRQHTGTWALVLSASDSSYSGAGYLTLTGRNTVERLDDFGGGTIP